MGFIDSAKKSLVSNFNFKEWLGARMLQQSTGVVRDIYKNFRSVSATPSPGLRDVPMQQQSFAEVMARNGITEEELKRIQQRTKILLKIYGFCFVVVLAYSIFLIARGYYEASLFSFVLLLVLLSFMFREHFNYFQMKERRLGCSFKDWFTALFRGNAK